MCSILALNRLVGDGSLTNNTWKLGWNKNDKGWCYCTDAVNKYYYTSNFTKNMNFVYRS